MLSQQALVGACGFILMPGLSIVVHHQGEARGGNNRSASASVADNNKENAGGEESAGAEGQVGDNVTVDRFGS